MQTILHVKMPEREKKELLKLADDQSRTMSSMVRALIKEEVKRVAIRDGATS